MQLSARTFALASLSLVLPLGCGGGSEETPPPNTQQNAYAQQYPQQQYPQQQYPQQQYPQQQYPQQQVPQQQVPQQQVPQQQAPQQQAPQQPAAAQAVDVSMAAAVQPVVQQLGASQAPAGAKPLGGIIAVNFSAPGQTFEQQLQLTANKCYTVVAVGGPGVGEVNIKFAPPIPLAVPVAEDKSTGPQAVLGASNSCWKQIMISGPMRMMLEVPQGQGIVAAQVYEK